MNEDWQCRAEAAELERDALSKTLDAIAQALGRYHAWDYGWQRADDATLIEAAKGLTAAESERAEALFERDAALARVADVERGRGNPPCVACEDVEGLRADLAVAEAWCAAWARHFDTLAAKTRTVEKERDAAIARAEKAEAEAREAARRAGIDRAFADDMASLCKAAQEGEARAVAEAREFKTRLAAECDNAHAARAEAREARDDADAFHALADASDLGHREAAIERDAARQERDAAFAAHRTAVEELREARGEVEGLRAFARSLFEDDDEPGRADPWCQVCAMPHARNWEKCRVVAALASAPAVLYGADPAHTPCPETGHHDVCPRPESCACDCAACCKASRARGLASAPAGPPEEKRLNRHTYKCGHEYTGQGTVPNTCGVCLALALGHTWTRCLMPTSASAVCDLRLEAWPDLSWRCADGHYNSPETLRREALGRLVREVWVVWAHDQDSPKPHHLVPWEGLGEGDREVDRRIGETLLGIRDWRVGQRSAAAPAGPAGPTTDEPTAESYEIRAARARLAEVRECVAMYDGGPLSASLSRDIAAAEARLAAVSGAPAGPAPQTSGTVPRPHCDRCDRCGWPLALAPHLGCVAGNCSQREGSQYKCPPLRSTCAGCGAAFEDAAGEGEGER